MTRHLSKPLIAGAVALSAMVGAWTPAAAQMSEDTMRIAFDREMETLDAYFNTAREGIIVARLVWDTLLDRDLETGEYKGLLAKSYKFVDDTTMEFELREGVTFHNGEPFDADDVVYTLNWAANPESNVTTQANVNWIDHAEKLDQYKVRLYMKQPFPAALEYLSSPIVMYPNEYHAAHGSEMGVKPIGTGPYKVTDVDPGQRFVFEKNDGYFEGGPKGQPSIGKLVVRTVQDPNTRLAELMSGGLDWIWRVPVDQAERLQGRDDITVVNESTMRIGYLFMDAIGRAGESPLQNKLVRQAIAHAIDRQAIVDALVKGASKVVHSACFPSQFGCEQDVVKYDYDPAKSKELLAEAGYPDGFTVSFSAYRERPFAEAMISMLNEVGIQVDFGFYKYAALRDKIHNSEVPMAFMTWGSNSVNDVSAITSVFFKHLADDYAKDDEVKAWLDAGDTTVDPEERKANYSKALKKIAEEAYWLPLWSYNVWYAFSKDVNFTPSTDELPRFYTATWNK